jgi:uncharacterized protein YbjT (DUF2867 family)
MKITVTGSLGNISRVLVEKLIANGHEVKVITSNAEKAKQIEKLKAIPLIGSLSDPEFVSESFKDADAVYTMVPPDFSVPDYYAFSDQVHQNYVQAIIQHKIQYVVNLSSVGVAFAGTGSLANYYNLEKRLNEIPGLNIVHLRPAMFYSNFYGSVPLVKHQGIVGHNVGEKIELIMTHPADIADTAFGLLHALSFKGQQVKYIVSDIKTGSEIAKILSEAVNKPVNWVEFPDTVLLEALQQNGFTKETAETYVIAAGKGFREGLFNDLRKNEYKLPESRQFVDFAKEFAMACQGS